MKNIPLAAHIGRCAAPAFVLLFATGAQAAMNISTQATQNVTCSAGVCTSTAPRSFLNVNDLTNMLAAGDLKVVTGGGEQDINVGAGFSWTSASRLTLDAQRTIRFQRRVMVAGNGGVTLQTNDGGSGGDYLFIGDGRLVFADSNSSLVINGLNFRLVTDLGTLAQQIANHPYRHYALANDYDAGADGIYTSTPVPTPFSGIVEGLGNSISNLAVRFETGSPPYGFFSQTTSLAVIRDLTLSNLLYGTKHQRNGQAHPLADAYVVGGLVGSNAGVIAHVAASGTIYSEPLTAIGGLTGVNSGSVTASSFSGAVDMNSRDGGISHMGGIAGDNTGNIQQSFASGSVVSDHHSNGIYGGLAGTSSGSIVNSYETASAEGSQTTTAVLRTAGWLETVAAPSRVLMQLDMLDRTGTNTFHVGAGYWVGAMTLLPCRPPSICSVIYRGSAAAVRTDSLD